MKGGQNTFCTGFRLGNCLATVDGLHCAANPAHVHQYSFCKEQGHGEHNCWLKQQGTQDGGQDGSSNVSARENECRNIIIAD